MKKILGLLLLTGLAAACGGPGTGTTTATIYAPNLADFNGATFTLDIKGLQVNALNKNYTMNMSPDGKTITTELPNGKATFTVEGTPVLSENTWKINATGDDTFLTAILFGSSVVADNLDPLAIVRVLANPMEKDIVKDLAKISVELTFTSATGGTGKLGVGTVLPKSIIKPDFASLQTMKDTVKVSLGLASTGGVMTFTPAKK